MAEGATAIRVSAAHLLWDVEKFYDSINVVLLARFAVRHGFPVAVLAMDLHVHLGLRVIRWHQTVSLFSIHLRFILRYY